MNFPFFNLLTAIIAIPEPAIADDDTAPFVPVVVTPEPPVMHTSPIILGGVTSPKELLNTLVAYRMDRTSEWQVGNIRGYEDGREGVSFLFEPKDTRLLTKWRSVNDLVYVWYE